ncbi:cytochrome P450 [Mycena albidolilacea]|uniref:Cytochrome P450 n=1 Tax=Mycena albidolilacea TaxID=1033008 RepID=A0AAD7F1W8_9AGAR|nr:cytochrome P450 [Mycena albidolilacea]
MSVPIPQPSTIPFFGNVTSMEREIPLRSFQLLAKTYGEIFQLTLLEQMVLFVNSYELVNELSDGSRFKKRVTGALRDVRNLVGDALFTVLGTVALTPSWPSRLTSNSFGPNAIIDPSDDFTRVALDTVAYCSMSHRLNSFYSEPQPEFAIAMADPLKERSERLTRPRLPQAVMYGKTAKYQADIKKMKDLADEIVSTRKAPPIPKHDLLDIMPNSRDPKTNNGLSSRLVSDNGCIF